MKLNVKISESVINRISNLSNSCSGQLFGIYDNSSLFIIALKTDDIDVNFLPAGIEDCGTFQTRVDNESEIIPSKPKAIWLTRTIGKDSDVKAYIEENGNFNKIMYSAITDQEINNTFLFIRLKGEIPLKSEYTPFALQETFQVLQKTALYDLVFSYAKSNFLLLKHQTIGIESNISLNEFCEDSNSFNDDTNRKKKLVNLKPRILDFNILKHLTVNNTGDFIKEHAPILIFDKTPCKVIETNLQLDCLSMIPSKTEIQHIYDILVESVKRNLKLFEPKLLSFVTSSSPTTNLTCQVLHFYPEVCQHFLTILFDKEQQEKDLKLYRLKLHKSLLLDTTAPCFRRANTYNFDSKKMNGPLINPHEGLKRSDNGGIVALVKGKYEYYHYCQNKMDDNGWGCAYRSLQTLASWFKLQGFVEREVPTFKEIQQCLVDIKDKPANFVGSRQWIGSTEVNFVLNTLLGVENKILYVSSGEDMGTMGPELVNHFQNYGSPVMIGGGVLAHTILGVDYNQQTGNIKFLILDPHYTGGEDLHIIQNKGWCGWKNVDFWDKASYYNMCLPLVPREV